MYVGSLFRNPSASAVVISQSDGAAGFPLAVGGADGVCACFAPSQHVRATPPFAAVSRFQALHVARGAGMRRNGSGRGCGHGLAPISVRQTIAGEGWWQDLRREVRLQRVSTRERLEGEALIVAAVVFLILLRRTWSQPAAASSLFQTTGAACICTTSKSCRDWSLPSC